MELENLNINKDFHLYASEHKELLTGSSAAASRVFTPEFPGRHEGHAQGQPTRQP